MNYDNYGQNGNHIYYGNYSTPRRENGFSIASLSLGILSIVTCFLGVASIPLAALAFLFAILSRGRNRPLTGFSITGICTGAIGFLIGIVILYFSFRILYDPIFRAAYVDPFYQELYGVDFMEFLQNNSPMIP